jgi:hypothetical protein
LKWARPIGVLATAWMFSFVVVFSWAKPQSSGEFHSAAQSVRLFAQLPETAGVAWFIRPVPQTLLENGQTADVVVLQESWTFARGQTVEANCQVVTEPQAAAEFFSSKPQYVATSFSPPASFLGTSQVQTFPLVAKFDPARGPMTDTQSLVIVRNAHGDVSSAGVRITVVAL